MTPRGLTIGKTVVLPRLNFFLRVVKNKASVRSLHTLFLPLVAGILLTGLVKNLFSSPEESREEKVFLFSVWQKKNKILASSSPKRKQFLPT